MAVIGPVAGRADAVLGAAIAELRVLRDGGRLLEGAETDWSAWRRRPNPRPSPAPRRPAGRNSRRDSRHARRCGSDSRAASPKVATARLTAALWMRFGLSSSDDARVLRGDFAARCRACRRCCRRRRRRSSDAEPLRRAAELSISAPMWAASLRQGMTIRQRTDGFQFRGRQMSTGLSHLCRAPPAKRPVGRGGQATQDARPAPGSRCDRSSSCSRLRRDRALRRAVKCCSSILPSTASSASRRWHRASRAESAGRQGSAPVSVPPIDDRHGAEAAALIEPVRQQPVGVHGPLRRSRSPSRNGPRRRSRRGPPGCGRRRESDMNGSPRRSRRNPKFG